MADLQVGDELSAALHEMAAGENLSVEALLNDLLIWYRIEANLEPLVDTPDNESWHGAVPDNFIGMFDDDIDDLSISIRELVTTRLEKNMPVLVDTNILVAANFNRDTNHEATAQAMKDIRNEISIRRSG